MSPENRVASTLPLFHHLIIVTEKHVHSWHAEGWRIIFTSGSSGILAAKEANDGSRTLAIADSQVVVLHKLDQGPKKSYNLRGLEVTLTATGGPT
jgi:hypothetical protein